MIVRPVLCRPFVGRREEIAYLRERRLEAGASRGALVTIAGDAGVGKSRLIAEFCESLAYAKWRIGYGPSLEFASRPYGPFLDALADIDERPFVLGHAATKREQFDAIVDRFAALSARKAALVVLEDIHWADAATLDLLAYLATKVQRMRVLVLASFRADELNPEHPATSGVSRIVRHARAARIDLAPLRGVELRTFIDEALAGFSLPEETRRAIALAGDGNPFFTEELLKSAVESRASRETERKRQDLPRTLRGTLLERLAPFDDAERRVVAQAAVIGRTFGLDLLATTLGREPESLLPTLRRARDFQLLEEVSPSVFRFRHGLTRDAIYGDFLGAEARPRHRAIAEALESAPDGQRTIEALAYHSWAAGDDARSARYNESAGDAAAHVHAHEDAIAFYERVREIPDLDASVHGSIVEKIADRRLALGFAEEASATFAAAADIFRDARAFEREAACRAHAAIMAYVIGLPEPTAALEAMLARLDPGEHLALARVHLGLAWLAATFWFPSRAAQHLAQVDARALAAAPDIGLRYHNVSAWVAMTFGDLATFRREHDAWIEAARRQGSARALASAHSNGAMCYAFFARHDEALDHVERALRVAREANSRHNEEHAHAIAAIVHVMRGDLSRARAAVEAVPAATENRVNATFAISWGTLVGAYLDDRGLLEKWFESFEASISAEPDVECGAAFAEVMVRRGRARDAAALLHRAMPECELMRGNALALLAWARHASPADRARARACLARGADCAAELPERPALALFDAIVHRSSGRSAEAAALGLEAAAGFRRLRMPLLEAQACEAAGDRARALVLYRACGAAYDVRRLEGSHAGETATSALSAREREIATLAARGRSNLEIARELSITHKTVEKHLSSVYAKLRVTSRSQLGGFALSGPAGG